jgi:hypothetical protein
MVNQLDKKEEFKIQDIEFMQYVDEVGNNMKDFKMKPKFFVKSIYNHKDFEKIKRVTKVYSISPIEVYYKNKYEFFHKICKDDEKCTICMENVYEFDLKTDFFVIKIYNEEMNYQYKVCMLQNCSDHFFHTECLSNMIGENNFIKCPVCSKIYGKMTGSQPPGTMSVNLMKGTKCSGFNCDTICVNYTFPGGKGFTGTSRTAYLPYNQDGLKVLGLFKEAFDRKLIFTVGTSVTTGATNTTVWAGIHHKTSLSGGTSAFGYPDETYFTRVQEELAVKGVIAESCDEDPVKIGEKLLGGKIIDNGNSGKPIKGKKK